MEWLANLTVKWVLVLVGLLLLARIITLYSGRRDAALAAACREFLEAALIAVVAVFLLIRPFLFQAYFIPSESMRMTLVESDRVLVNKLVYRLAPPRRGDIVVFRPPEDRVPEAKDYIKRIVALPGESVEVVPERLLVDGRVLMRITRQSASEIMDENYESDRPVGYTFPIGQGGVTLKEGRATLSAGVSSALQVVPISPEDQVVEEHDRVLLNGEPLITLVFGPLEVSEDLAQWGGDPDLRGRVYSLNGEARLILVHGQRLALDPGHVLVEGRRLDEPYVSDPPMYAMLPLRIPAGHYFVLGDNRNHSLDSHAWGPLEARRIYGRADAIFWPPARLRPLR